MRARSLFMTVIVCFALSCGGGGGSDDGGDGGGGGGGGISAVFEKIGSDLRVTYSTGFSRGPHLCWGPGEFGIAWGDDSDSNWHPEIVSFTRISAVGALIAPEIKVTPSSISFLSLSSLVWTGTEYGLGWAQDSSGTNTLARLTSSGDTIGAVPIATQYSDFETGLEWTGSEFGLAFNWLAGDIFFVRTSASGDTIGVESVVTGEGQNKTVSSLEWAGGEYGITWSDSRSGAYETYFARVSSTGAKIGADVRVTYYKSDFDFTESSDLAWSSSEYGLCFSEMRDDDIDVFFVRLSASGAVIGSEVNLSSNSGDSQQCRILWDGENYVASWWQEDGGYANVYMAKVSANGEKKGGSFNVTSEYNSGPYSFSIAWTGSEYGVAWEDDRDGKPQIYFARVKKK